MLPLPKLHILWRPVAINYMISKILFVMTLMLLSTYKFGASAIAWVGAQNQNTEGTSYKQWNKVHTKSKDNWSNSTDYFLLLGIAGELKIMYVSLIVLLNTLCITCINVYRRVICNQEYT